MEKHPSLTDDEWAAIKCPAFFINGENDPFGTCAELREKVPSAKIYEVKGGGHRPHFVGEQAKELNPMILDFFILLMKLICEEAVTHMDGHDKYCNV